MHHLLEGGADESRDRPDERPLPFQWAYRRHHLHARALKKRLEDLQEWLECLSP